MSKQGRCADVCAPILSEEYLFGLRYRMVSKNESFDVLFVGLVTVRRGSPTSSRLFRSCGIPISACELLPSIEDGWGRVMGEAMACAKQALQNRGPHLFCATRVME